MIWSGLLIYWANDVYGIRFSEEIYAALSWSGRLAEGMAWHFVLQWVFLANGIAFALYLAWTGDWRELLPSRQSPGEAWQVVLYDLGVRKKAPPVTGKFNGAQRILYTGIIACGALSGLTGYVMYKPVQLGWLTALVGGYEAARWIHFWLTVGYVVFFCLHVAQVIRSGWNTLRGMITGYEIE